MVWNNRLEVLPEYFPIGDITKEIWKEHKEAIGFYMGHITLESIFQQENANLFLSFLHEMRKHKYKKDYSLSITNISCNTYNWWKIYFFLTFFVCYLKRFKN